MEVIKRRLSTISADKFLPPAASTAGATHGRAEDEEMALNESEQQQKRQQPGQQPGQVPGQQKPLTSTTQQNPLPYHLESMSKGKHLMAKAEMKDDKMKDDEMKLSQENVGYKQMMTPSDEKTSKKEGEYVHQPLTENLLAHHTQLEKLKVRL